ncbi:hypothetical protein ACFWF3_25590, partial [Nocardia sp. NPDC060220]|uniref:hypothetical protein n=1 Tax=Nocardia sp. NPDC060220 TaxID=3347076 RepID=UPI003648AD47
MASTTSISAIAPVAAPVVTRIVTDHRRGARTVPTVVISPLYERPAPAVTAKPPKANGLQGFRGHHVMSADHSGGNPDDPVAIQFQNSVTRLRTNA